MATTLAGSIHVGVDLDYITTQLGLTGTTNLRYNNSPTAYTSGTGSNQMNAVYVSLAYSLAGTSVGIDLNLQTDIFGNTFNFTKLKLIYIKNLASLLASPSGNYLKVSGNFLDGDTSNLGPLGGADVTDVPWLYVGPGGMFLWDSPIDGATVTNTTKDTITLTNAATFTLDIILGGTI